MELPVDPASPVPLYHQIAEALRLRIERGELQAGDALDPIRRAADRWGVNLHTVRHAYAALAREGLLEMRTAKGTRVTPKARRLARRAAESTDAFVERVRREALERHGLAPEALARRIAQAPPARPRVAVIECSAWQCASHAAELTERWRVDAVPWTLAEEVPPEADVLVATYFHCNDLRRSWPQLLPEVRFVTIGVADTLADWLDGAPSAVLVERDEPTAEAVAGDLRVAIERPLELRLVATDDPAAVVKSATEPVLCSPRVWDELDEATRADPRCQVVRYVFDEEELEALARRCGWEPVRSARRSEEVAR